MTKLTRRSALGLAAAALALSTTAAQAKPAKVPEGWDGKKMYETMTKDGVGFRSPTPASVKKTAHVFFDTQCPDCIRLMDRIMPLQDRIAVVYYPIALLNPHCEPQGALILGSKDPYAMLIKHHEHFRDKDFRGLRYEGADLNCATRCGSTPSCTAAAAAVPFPTACTSIPRANTCRSMKT